MSSAEVLAILFILAMLYIVAKNEAEKSKRMDLINKYTYKSERIMTKLKCDLCTHVHYVLLHPELIDEESIAICPWCERETTFEIVGKKEVDNDKDNGRIS